MAEATNSSRLSELAAAARVHKGLFISYVIVLIIGAVASVVFTVLVWSSGNRLQEAEQNAADDKITALKNENLKLQTQLAQIDPFKQPLRFAFASARFMVGGKMLQSGRIELQFRESGKRAHEKYGILNFSGEGQNAWPDVYGTWNLSFSGEPKSIGSSSLVTMLDKNTPVEELYRRIDSVIVRLPTNVPNLERAEGMITLNMNGLIVKDFRIPPQTPLEREMYIFLPADGKEPIAVDPRLIDFSYDRNGRPIKTPSEENPK